MRALLGLAFLCALTATAAAGKNVKFTEWTPPDKCIVDRGGVDEEGGNNAGLSRRVLDKKKTTAFLPNCDTGINWKKFRLVRVQQISNQRTAKAVKSAKIVKGKVQIEVDTDPICTGHDVYRRSLVWVLIPKSGPKVHVVQAPIPEGDGC
jgi:hypothetical protein